VEKHTSRGRRGITAIEVLVSLLVIGLALVPALGSSISVGRQTGFTRALALAHVLASSRLERVAARGFHELAEAAGRGEALAPAVDGAPRRAWPFEHVSEEIAFRELAPELAALTVTLTWRQPGEPSVHRVTAFRFVSPADASWTVSNPLPAPENTDTPAE
jgi:hypothetical protein